MVKGLFPASIAIVMMTACSVDEGYMGYDEPATPEEITFSVTTTPASRQTSAAGSHDNDNEFFISARHDGISFINEEPVSLAGGKWINNGKPHLWPAEGDVDFFAYQYDKSAMGGYAPVLDVEKDEARLCMFNVDNDASRQAALRYATSLHRTADGGSVPVQFQQALSDIEFAAQNSSRHLHVEISEVTVSHVYMHGDFIFPYGRQQASWDVSISEPQSSKATFPVKSIGNNMESLGAETTMHLIPQSQDNATSEADYTDGACITFRCAVWLLDEESESPEESDTMLIGEKNPDGSVTFGELRIPVSINWQPGYRYIYSVNFGAGGNSCIPVAGGIMLPIAFSAHSEPIQ